MPRYEITYRNVEGLSVRRILFADCDAEVAELIRQEKLTGVSVKPSLRLAPQPPIPPSRPPGQAAGKPPEIEIISTPPDYRGDKSGWNPDWTLPDERDRKTAAHREARRREAWARHHQAVAARAESRKMRPGYVEAIGGTVTERIEDAIIRGTLDIGREYTLKEVEAIIGGSITGGADEIRLRLAANAVFRAVVESRLKGRAVKGGGGISLTFHNRQARAAA